MKDDNETTEPTETEGTEAKPRKLKLTKRVLRQFNVRSGVMTGMMGNDDVLDASYRGGVYSITTASYLW